MNFPGVNSATFIEDIFLLTHTRLQQQPLIHLVLLRTSASKCIKQNKQKYLVMKIALKWNQSWL